MVKLAITRNNNGFKGPKANTSLPYEKTKQHSAKKHELTDTRLKICETLPDRQAEYS